MFIGNIISINQILILYYFFTELDFGGGGVAGTAGISLFSIFLLIVFYFV